MEYWSIGPPASLREALRAGVLEYRANWELHPASAGLECPFRARLTEMPNPGLKAWAIIFSPFVASECLGLYRRLNFPKLFTPTLPPLTRQPSRSSRTGQPLAQLEYHHEIAGPIGKRDMFPEFHMRGLDPLACF